jgi:hypothetical protein
MHKKKTDEGKTCLKCILKEIICVVVLLLSDLTFKLDNIYAVDNKQPLNCNHPKFGSWDHPVSCTVGAGRSVPWGKPNHSLFVISVNN